MRIGFSQTLAAIFAASLSIQTATATKSCKALVLSGGANNGAWEMGVIWGFVNYGNASDFNYDVVTGVSVGSINSLFFSGWPIGEEKAMVEAGTQLWKYLKNEDVWVNWMLSPVMGFVNKQGLLDNRPLLKLLNEISSGFYKLYRRISLSAMNIETGQIEVFN